MPKPGSYSFESVVAVFSHPLIPDISFSGNIGAGQFVIKYSTDRTVTDTASDGGIMMSKVMGMAGGADIEMQQTSLLHDLFVTWFNVVDAADASYWTQGMLVIRDKQSGRGHILTGVAPTKIPDHTYTGQGSKYTWSIVAGNVQTV